jgi:hypothetical protein
MSTALPATMVHTFNRMQAYVKLIAIAINSKALGIVHVLPVMHNVQHAKDNLIVHAYPALHLLFIFPILPGAIA